VVTAVPNASLVVGQSISASSLIASISNPSGDDITNDIYEDLGGGSGYFTVNGVRQADGVWISAAPSENVQYVAGASPGSDTLGVGIYDATTNSNISASVIATTIHAAPVVTAVPNVSLAEGQSISASSLFASISNPSGDDILEDIYEDFGGGSGYFTVDGLKYPGTRIAYRSTRLPPPKFSMSGDRRRAATRLASESTTLRLIAISTRQTPSSLRRYRLRETPLTSCGRTPTVRPRSGT
jgi:hypothetical protein